METDIDMGLQRTKAINFFRQQGKRGITSWLAGTPIDGIVRAGILECFRASIEGAGGIWKVTYNRPHTQAPTAPPPKGSMDFIPVSAACLTGVLVLDFNGEVFPGPNFPKFPGSEDA